MKLPKLLLLFLSSLIFYGTILAQQPQRGVKPIKVTIEGLSTTLYEQSHALLIGVSTYTNGMPSLPGVIEDIQAVKEALENNGFDTRVIMNPDNIALQNAFNTFIADYGQNPESRLLIYFAGHGHTKKMVYGDDIGYILPANCPNPQTNPNDFQTRAMPMGQIELFATQIQAKHALFMFDACFSGSVFTPSRDIPGVITYKTAKPVRQFISSGSADETVPDKSIFRMQFIAALNGEADYNKDGFVTGTELGDFLQTQVINYSRNTQHPQFGKILNPNLDKGDFVFVLKPGGSNQQTLVHYGKLSLTSQIQGELYIDGSYVRQVSSNMVIPLNNLAEGTHTLKISGEETQEKAFFILPDQTVSLNIEKKKQQARVFDNFEMIFVEGGTFQMGSNKGSSCEAPVHPVTVNSFYIGKYEVTQKQWQDVMGNNPSNFNKCINCPVESVSWNDVQVFLIRLNQKTGKKYRLLTEAEWEFAASGGMASKVYEYSGSYKPDEVAWYKSTSDEKTHPFGQKKPNELGIYDMSGNVWEWCSDFFDKNYYLDSPKNNPKGPIKTSTHVLRGGAWDCTPTLIRIRNRGNTVPDDKSSIFGFRICLSE